MNHSDVSATTNSNVLPPDVAEARKTRINKNLIECFQRKVGAIPPSTKGIGLYTHTEGLVRDPVDPCGRNVSRIGDPEYLPIGGPRKIGRGSGLKMDMNEDVRKLWAEVSSTVKAEEALVPATTSVKELNKRYGALNTSGLESQFQQSSVGGGTISMGGTRDGTVHLKMQKSLNFNPHENTDRPSSGIHVSNSGPREAECVIMGDTVERAAATTDTGNMYDVSRDPRRRR